MMRKEKILFLRNRPQVFNLGDFLCTPRYYFDFFCDAYESAYLLKNEVYKVILGGGAYNDLGVGQPVDPKKTVVWGVGSSIPGADSLPTRGDDLPFFLYGLRDPDAVSDPNKVLPCVSCLHPLVKIPPGSETNIFLNFDSAITDPVIFAQDALSGNDQLNIYTNYLNELQFMKAFAKTRRVVTNSYHVSYWSLLSGREVAIIGYSSKFRSLLRLFGLDPKNIHPYDVKNRPDLASIIHNVLRSGNFYKLRDPRGVHEDFILKNVRFAQECKRTGFIRDFRVREHRWTNMVEREVKYKVFQKVSELVKR